MLSPVTTHDTDLYDMYRMWQIGNHQNRVDKNNMVEGSLAGNALITKTWPSLERIWVVQKQIGKQVGTGRTSQMITID